jgi:hypothetical protein
MAENAACMSVMKSTQTLLSKGNTMRTTDKAMNSWVENKFKMDGRCENLIYQT